jgi:plastocyanin
MITISTRRRGALAATLLAAVAAAAIGLGGALGPASASAADGAKLIKAADDCETASFDAAVGPGTCIGEGRTTFGAFVGQLLERGAAKRWYFSADRVHVHPGERVVVRNDGGEFHTFTEVARYGGACIPAINALLGTTPPPECQPEVAPGVPLAFVTSGVAQDGTLAVTGLARGTHRFQCLIHPWMRTTVDVR